MILDCLAVRIYLFRKYHSFYLEEVTQEESIIDYDHVVYTLLLIGVPYRLERLESI